MHTGRLVSALVAILLAGLSARAGVALYLTADKGALEIRTEDESVRVIAEKNGKQITVVDPTGKKTWVVDAGDCTIRLEGSREAAPLRLDRPFALLRGDREVVTIRRLKGPLALAPVPERPRKPRGKPELVRHIAWQDEDQGFPAHIYGTTFTPDGKHYIGFGDSGPRGGIRMWEVATGKQVREFLPGKETWWGSAAVSPDGKHLVGNYTKDNDVYVWEIATGKLVRTFEGLTGPGRGVDVAPDSRRVLSGSADRTVRAWDVVTRKALLKLEDHEGDATGRFSPDGKHVLTVSEKTLRLWDAAKGKLLARLEGHTEACGGTFSPDGKKVLSWSGDRTLRLWDVSTGKLLHKLEGHTEGVAGAAFVRGRREVLSWGADKTLRFWDVGTGKEGRRIDLGADQQGQVVLTPDLRLVLTYHQDETLRVRSLATGRELHRYEGLKAGSGFSVSPDGEYCACGSFRAGVSLFRLPEAVP